MLSALLSLVLLAALAAPGIAALGRFAPFLSPLERYAHGAVLGIVVGTLALLPAGAIAGFTALVVAALAVVALLVAVVLGGRPANVLADLASVRSRIDPVATLVIGAFAIRWAVLWSSALTVQADGLWAGHEYIWSDWPTHLGIVSAFAYGGNFPPEHTLFAGLPLSYHHLSDLTPAAFVTLGMDPITALPLHSFVLSVVVALGLYAFVRRLSRSRAVATLAVVLFLLGGGLGWIATLARFEESNDLVQTLLTAPWDHRAQGELHIRFFNPYLAFLMSQRAYLYGLPLAMLFLSILLVAVRRPGVGLFAVAGIVAGFLPLSHLPTLLAMAMTTPFLALFLAPRPWDLRTIRWSGWIVFHVAWVLVALPQLALQLGGGSGALSAFRFQLGWVAQEPPYNDPWWWFWIKNLGAFVPLLLAAFFSRRLLTPRGWRLTLALMPIFVVANLMVFQPWDWDNHKILVYWFLGVAILVAAVVVRTWQGHGTPAVRALLSLAVLAMVLGPALENLDMWEGNGRYRMISTEGIELAVAIRETTEPDALIVSGMQSHDPVMMLSGRQLLMGYWGQLWVSGIAYQGRQADVEEILTLGPRADELIRRYGVDYVVVGPDPAQTDHGGVTPNRDGFVARYPVTVQVGGYLVFDVRGAT